MVICLELGADLHMAQLKPLPLTVSCFSKIQIGFTFLVPAHLGSPQKRAIKRVCVCLLKLLQNFVCWHCRLERASEFFVVDFSIVLQCYSSCCKCFVCGHCRVEPANEYYDGERDNDRDDAAVDV